MSLTKVSYSMIDGGAVNILDYGASTASADNTAAIQAALNTGLDVYIPAGNFVCTDTLSMNTPFQTLFGNGNKSQITFTFGSSKPGLIMGVPTGPTACDQQTLRNVFLLGTANVSKVVSIKGPQSNILNNRIQNQTASGAGIVLEDEDTPNGVYCFGQKIVGNWIDGIKNVSGVAVQLGTYNQTTVLLYNIITDWGLGIYVNGATSSLNIQFNVIQAISASNAAIYINRTGSAMPAYNINISNNYFEEIFFAISVDDCLARNLTISSNFAYRNNTGVKANSAFYVSGTAMSATSDNIIVESNYIEDFGSAFLLTGEYGATNLTSTRGNQLDNTTNWTSDTWQRYAFTQRKANGFFVKQVTAGSIVSESALRIESVAATYQIPIQFERGEIAQQFSFYYVPVGGGATCTVILYERNVTTATATATSIGTITVTTEALHSVALNNKLADVNCQYYFEVDTSGGSANYVYPMSLWLRK